MRCAEPSNAGLDIGHVDRRPVIYLRHEPRIQVLQQLAPVDAANNHPRPIGRINEFLLAATAQNLKRLARLRSLIQAGPAPAGCAELVRYTGIKHNVPCCSCWRGLLDNGKPRCIAFGGLHLNDAIEEALLRVVEQGAIAAADAKAQAAVIRFATR
ncbi:hypothetical protein [Mesorhizobium sp.]|uniref:hypothetical protein n=1 Tax=Mesorhizobium sp. TaxID=1871066 RepID=UPI0025BC41A7|nr:hypothetical protein [Mesorhizobium sp.]